MWSGDAVSRRRVIAAYLARPSSSWRRSWGGTTAPSRRCTSSGGIGCDAAIPGGAPGWRLALYLGGLVALCRALLSPIDTLGSLLFVVHMTQHELLTMVAPPTILWGRSPALRWRAAGLLRPNARTRRHKARHRVQPSHTSPSVRPRSSRMRRGRTGTAGSASAGVNRSGCARSPVIVRASALGAPSGVQLPELRDGLLHHLAAHALPSGPAASSGDLAVLPPRRIAQGHCPVFAPGRARKSMNLVGTTRAVPVPGVPRLGLIPRRGPQPGVAPLELWKLG
jgi:hypothetical protein